jgi:hypothetical protein
MTDFFGTYENSDIDPVQQPGGVLSDLPGKQWRRSDGKLWELNNTPLKNLYNLQIYIDKRINDFSHLNMHSSVARCKISYYEEWALLVAEQIKLSNL